MKTASSSNLFTIDFLLLDSIENGDSSGGTTAANPIPAGAIVGGIVGGIVSIAILTIVVRYLLRGRSRDGQSDISEKPAPGDSDTLAGEGLRSPQ